MRRAVKYCGGCNPRFDRVELVLRLEAALGQSLQPARLGEPYDELYVICGCSARCADTSALRFKSLILLDSAQLPENVQTEPDARSGEKSKQ